MRVTQLTVQAVCAGRFHLECERKGRVPVQPSTTARLIALNNLQSAIFGQKRGFVATNRAMSRCRTRIQGCKYLA